MEVTSLDGRDELCSIFSWRKYFPSFLVELPSIKINEENGQAESDVKQTKGIQVRTQPVATSFAIFDE